MPPVSSVLQHQLSLTGLSSTFTDVRSVCKQLMSSPLLSTLVGRQYRVSRVVLLRNDHLLTRVIGHYATAQSRAQRIDTIRVQQWSTPPPDNLQGEARAAWQARRQLRLQLESLPSFQRMPDVTGTVQVFHGCANEALAWHIVSCTWASGALRGKP